MDQKAYLQQIEQVIQSGKFRDDWASLSGYRTPDWYYGAKFGIFIHWGIYSVPAYGTEWYSREMYDPTHREYEFHRKTFGNQKEFGYKDFIPMFRGEKFDADEWAALFQRAGAKYVMPVFEHHDGFAMYDTAFNRWNAVNMGPCRDVAGEIKKACEKRGLTFCASSHRAEHYFFMNMGRAAESDVTDEAYRDFYGPAYLCPELYGDEIFGTMADTFSPVRPDEAWMEDWLVRTCELVDRYRPWIVYFDSWIQNAAYKPYLKKFCAYYYNRAAEWGQEVGINYKHQAFPPGVATFDVERGALTGISPVPWQTDTAIGKQSWGYTKDNEFKPPRQIICDLIDIVSKNGMLLLNVGPRPDGTITEEETAVLEAVGKWLRVNGEGIYDTVPWRQFGEGEVNNTEGSFQDNDEKCFTAKDFRFTYKKGFLYAFWMNPEGERLWIRSLRIRGDYDIVTGSVAVLGDLAVTHTERDGEAMMVALDRKPDSGLPICLKIEIL